MSKPQDCPVLPEKRLKNTGTSTAYGDNGGVRVNTEQYRNNHDSIDWSKK